MTKKQKEKDKARARRRLARVADEVARAERARPTDELGTTGLMSFCGLVQEAYISELYYPAAYAKANEMRRRDPTIAAMLSAVNLLARTASWTVEPAGTEEIDQRAAEFLEQNIGDMSHTLEDSIEDFLSAIWFGWAWNEIVYKRRKGAGVDPESKYDDGLVGWRKFAPRRQSSFDHWELDATGGVKGLWQMIVGDASRRFIPIEKSLHFTAQREMGNPEGLPLFEHVYEAWHFVKNLQIINGIGFERSFVGLPVFTYGTAENPYEPSSDDKALVAKTGKGLRVDEKAFVAVPGQIGFRLESTTNQGAAAILETIRHYRISILQVLLADFIALGTTASGGSYSLGADKSLLFLLAIDGWLDKIAHPDKLGILNRYAVPRLFKYNSFDGITDYPRIKHSSVQKPDLAGLAQYLTALTAFIHPDALLEAELRKMAKLPEAEKNPPVDSRQSPDEELSPRGDTGEADTGDGPATGEEADTPMGGDSEMGDPHPPARGQRRYFLSEWRKLASEFRAAMEVGTKTRHADDVAYLARGDHNGVMVALEISEGMGKQLLEQVGGNLPDGSELVDLDELHLTLLYLGDSDTMTATHDAIVSALNIFASNHAPLHGKVNGIGRFSTGDSNERVALYASFDSPDLPTFQHDLVEMLAAAGIIIPKEHGFIPHITLAYVPVDANEISVEMPVMPITFNHFILAWRGNWESFRLIGKQG